MDPKIALGLANGKSGFENGKSGFANATSEFEKRFAILANFRLRKLSSQFLNRNARPNQIFILS